MYAACHVIIFVSLCFSWSIMFLPCGSLVRSAVGRLHEHKVIIRPNLL